LYINMLNCLWAMGKCKSNAKIVAQPKNLLTFAY